MKIHTAQNGAIAGLDAGSFYIPFCPERYGFFAEEDGQPEDIALVRAGNGFEGHFRELWFSLHYCDQADHLAVQIRIENRGADWTGRIGFHMGVDCYMEGYPQWHTVYFPTLLRCEKTHLWGYYMNTAENALAIATDHAVASWDICYNQLDSENGGHRILGTDLLFFQNTVLPAHHPQDQKILKSGETYTNTLYLIPVEQKQNIKAAISRIAGIPLVDADKYTLETGECLKASVLCPEDVQTVLTDPDGAALADPHGPLMRPGLYRLQVEASSGKKCEASFFVRKSWDDYLEAAARNALAKPPRATTHTESFYGLFSCFLYHKHTGDAEIGRRARAAFHEIMPLIFDLEAGRPLIIPERIQNTACLVSLLTDMYEADPEHSLPYLECAARFGDFIMGTQDAKGAYRNRGTHYTCVVYIAKSMLELVQAERSRREPLWQERADRHYASARKAVNELVESLDNIQTEGEMTLEDGMLACSALQIGMLALTLPQQERQPYIQAAEYMLRIHSCLEQQLVPDARMNGASLRFWESQYDVMIRVNMLNSPHGWTGWTGYAHYYLYLLTGKKEHLLCLMNLMGSCVQLIDDTGSLRWAFCSQPYVRARAWVPDETKEIQDGYAFVETDEKAYRGKYEIREYTEQYIDMISGWYRTGSQRVTGGYEFCPLIYENGRTEDVDPQGGCCDNDVHEIFKCMEETVLKKAFLHEEEDGGVLTFGCRAENRDGEWIVHTAPGTETLVYHVKDKTGVRVQSSGTEPVQTVPAPL